MRTPPRTPNTNAFAERFVRSIKEECLSKLITLGEAHLRRAIREFVEHYHAERNHQGLGNRQIAPAPGVGSREGEIVVDERLGGLLRHYRRRPTA
ncbi:MAG: integrase core domain-containing protein [Planctomycetota bacterium]